MNNVSIFKSSLKKLKHELKPAYLVWGACWILICIVFNKPINLVLGRIGNFLFSTENPNQNVSEWAVVIFLVLNYLVRYYSKKQIAGLSIRLFCLMTPLSLWAIINLTIRFDTSIVFVESKLLPQTPIILIIPFIWLIEFIIFVYNNFKKPQEHRQNTSSFITDIAIDPKEENEDQEDKLGFSNFATRIAEEIKNVSSSESVVFGINGEWGEGKTSMINLIRQQLKKESYTVVDFHPWKTNSGKAMNQLFFDALKDGLKNKIWGINWQIDRYADALLQLDKSGISKTIWQLIFQPDSVERQKEKLAESMKLLDKNLVVVVDDLDRLAKNEIADVLKLMRDTANFPNLVFLAAYDRKYLKMAIKEEINEHNYENYMDKIVLWEAPIYRPQPRKYLDVLFSTLKEKKEIIPESDIDKLIFATSKTVQSLKEEDRRKNENTEKQEHTKTQYEIHSTIFTNLRDVKRFCNYLVFNYKAVIVIEDDVVVERRVNFEDFYYLYLLRHFYSDYYEQFHLAYHKLFKDRKSGKIETNYEKYKNLISNNIPKNEGDVNSEIPYSIVQRIVFNSGSPDAKSIIWYKNFLDYFYLGNHEEITMAHFSAMLKAENIEDFKTKTDTIIDKQIVSQFSWNTIIHALQSNFQLTKENINVFAQQLIWLSTTIDNSHFYKQIHAKLQSILAIESIDKEDLKINIWHFIVAEQLEKKVQNLIFQIIHDFKTGYESNPGYTNEYYLDIGKAFEISRYNYRSHIKNITEITMKTVGLFYCSYQELDKYHTLVDNKDIAGLMKEIALKFPVDFFNLLIIKDRRNFISGSTTTYANRFNDHLVVTFNDYEEVKTYLKNLMKRNDKIKVKVEKCLRYFNNAFFVGDIQLQESFYPDESDKDLFKDAYFIDDLSMYI